MLNVCEYDRDRLQTENYDLGLQLQQSDYDMKLCLVLNAEYTEYLEHFEEDLGYCREKLGTKDDKIDKLAALVQTCKDNGFIEEIPEDEETDPALDTSCSTLITETQY